MFFENLVVPDGGPDTLLELCLRYVTKNLHTIAVVDPETKDYRLRDGVVLPTELCESLLSMYQRMNRIDDKVLAIFHDRTKTKLRRIALCCSTVSDNGLKNLMDHAPEELEIIHCEGLTSESLDIINQASDNLTVLNIGVKTNIFSEVKHHTANYLFRAPKLRKLTIRRQSNLLHPFLMLFSFEHLVHVDLSECTYTTNLSCLIGIRRIRSLILYNVNCTQGAVGIICSLGTLRRLDISQSNEKFGKFLSPNELLNKIVRSLPELVSLDISGTNLAGSGISAEVLESTDIACDIPGLCTRVKNPLMFLGLYGTHHAACSRRDIPAELVSGDKNEKQIITAAIAYMDRPEILTRVLNELYHLFRTDNGENIVRIDLALAVVLRAMNQHIHEKNIQVSGSATLFYIVKVKDPRKAVVMKLKQRIITALLNGMQEHLEYEIMMRNGCLTLCQFKIPSDVVFEYERIVTILLHGVDAHQDGFVQRVAIYLLNSLACQVDGGQKRFLGDQGVIDKMLDLILDRLSKGICDDVLEVAWSAMWNVTDETPVNCKRFLDANGMQRFVECLKCFPEKDELLRNMMGLLGNVAEVASLRPRLMNDEFLSVFYGLLDSSSDGIEVSYNAAGVLAHMVCGGPDNWPVTVSRQRVVNRLAQAIERWDLHTERNINYRSFEPILGLLTVYHTPQCQHWAVWALANLTSVYPEKYCLLVESEGGISLLLALIAHPEPYDRIKALAATVINNCRNLKIIVPRIRQRSTPSQNEG